MTTIPTRARLLALLALAAALLAAPLAGVATAQAEARDTADACAIAPESGFTDRGDGERAEAIDCVAYYGITQGKTSTSYAPLDPVSRDQMASFLVRTLRVAGADIPEPGEPFDDVPDNNVHKDNIEILRATGITLGTGGNSYNPSGLVTRAQMASFVARQIEYVIAPEELPEPSEDYFTDDEGATPHEERINQLAEVGIVQGTGPETFNPGARVTRAQMALFLARDLDYMVEEHGVLLRRITATSAAVTAGPDLVDVTIGPSGGGTTTLLFVFDEAVASTTPVDKFKIWSFAAEPTTAGSANRDPSDPAIVRATFTTTDVTDATTASVERFAVQDSGGTPNPEGAAPLRDVALEEGETAAPDLVSVSRVGTSSSFAFTFDEPAHVVDAEGYHLVLNDGTEKTATGAPSGTGTTTHVIDFGITSTEAAAARRGHVLEGTVSDEAQEENGDPITGDPVEGTVNPLQAAPIVDEGSTTAPDLIAISLNLDAGTATLTFDEAITVTTGTLPPGPSGEVRVYDLSGAEVASSDITKSGNASIVATFGEGDLTELAAGASVVADTVRSVATSRPNAVDELGLETTFAALETTAPDLVFATKGASGDDRTVTFVFDEAIDTVVNTGSNPLSPTTNRFHVWAADGTPTQLTGCSAGSDADANKVTCSAAADSAVGGAIETAVLATVQADAVTDASDTYSNYEAGATV